MKETVEKIIMELLDQRGCTLKLIANETINGSSHVNFNNSQIITDNVQPLSHQITIIDNRIDELLTKIK